MTLILSITWHDWVRTMDVLTSTSALGEEEPFQNGWFGYFYTIWAFIIGPEWKKGWFTMGNVCLHDLPRHCNSQQREAGGVSSGLHILNLLPCNRLPLSKRNTSHMSYLSSYLLTKSPHQLFILSTWFVVPADDSRSIPRPTCLAFLLLF